MIIFISNCHHSSHAVNLGSLLSLILIFFLLKKHLLVLLLLNMALLIYNLHDIKSSYFKHTIQRLLVTYKVNYLSLQYNFEEFLLLLKKSKKALRAFWTSLPSCCMLQASSSLRYCWMRTVQITRGKMCSCSLCLLLHTAHTWDPSMW